MNSSLEVLVSRDHVMKVDKVVITPTFHHWSIHDDRNGPTASGHFYVVNFQEILLTLHMLLVTL